MQPTLKEIAELTGFSKTTVSLALRNHPKISKRTRARVAETAERVGYQPNPLVAAHMAMLRWKNVPKYQATLAVVADWKLDQLSKAHDAAEHYSEATIGRYLTGIRKRARELGFEVDSFSVHGNGMTGKRLSQILGSRGIRGVILTPLSRPEGNFELEWGRFAVVGLGYSIRDPKVHRVCHDNYSTMRELLRLLNGRGYQRIRLALNMADDVRVKNLWSAGFQSRIAHWDGYLNACNFTTSSWSRKGFLQWVEAERPDCVISIGDTVLEWLRGSGYRVPGDVSVVTVGKIGGDISGYSQNSELMGEAAVERLAGLLYCNEYGLPANPQITLVQGQWIEGSTL